MASHRRDARPAKGPGRCTVDIVGYSEITKPRADEEIKDSQMTTDRHSNDHHSADTWTWSQKHRPNDTRIPDDSGTRGTAAPEHRHIQRPSDTDDEETRSEETHGARRGEARMILRFPARHGNFYATLHRLLQVLLNGLAPLYDDDPDIDTDYRHKTQH